MLDFCKNFLNKKNKKMRGDGLTVNMKNVDKLGIDPALWLEYSSFAKTNMSKSILESEENDHAYSGCHICQNTAFLAGFICGFMEGLDSKNSNNKEEVKCRCKKKNKK